MRQLLALTVAIATAACSTAPPPTSSRPVERPATALPLPTPRPAPGGAIAPVPVPRPGRSAGEPFDLDRLGGATESAVLALIGDPDAVRQQPPGKVWIYGHGGCRIEVYLYPSVDVGSMAVLGTALIPADLPAAEQERCRRGLAHRTMAKQ